MVSTDETGGRRLLWTNLEALGAAERLEGARRRGENSGSDHCRWYPDSLVSGCTEESMETRTCSIQVQMRLRVEQNMTLNHGVSETLGEQSQRDELERCSPDSWERGMTKVSWERRQNQISKEELDWGAEILQLVAAVCTLAMVFKAC